MDEHFFSALNTTLAEERLASYGGDGADAPTQLARYLWNMALCESLYSPLQLAEIALRNHLHEALTLKAGTPKWYGTQTVKLLPLQEKQIREALGALQTRNKPLEAGRLVAEMHFGFWTSFFNKMHARTGIGYFVAKAAFPHAPKSAQNMQFMDKRWTRVRQLRNRVFHHERIIHWNDLDEQHREILELIAWMSPELHDLALALDRFVPLKSAGLQPWLAKVRTLTAPTSAQLPSVPENIAIVDAPFDATDGADTPFGKRYGGDVFPLSEQQLQALTQGKTLAIDVQNEYITFLTQQP